MSRKRVAIYSVFLIVLASILMLIQISHFGSLTGFVILTQNTEANFSSGTYTNTTYNGTAIVLQGSNNSGTYTSQIFDAGSTADWNNLSFNGVDSASAELLFAVDASSAVYVSDDEGNNWVQSTSNYGGGGVGTAYMFSDSSYLYIVHSGNRQIWRSSNLGVSWTIINNSFANSDLQVGDADENGNLFVVDGSGDVYKSIDQGVTWNLVSDFDPSSSAAAQGIAINSGGEIFIVNTNRDVFKSTNAGSSFTQVNESFVSSGTGIDDMTVDSNDRFYILFNTGLYKSTDSGVNWPIVNSTCCNQDGLRMHHDRSGDLYILDPSGDVYKSIDQGTSWPIISDFNGGATNNAKGMTNFISSANLSFKFRSCSSSDCSGESFVYADINDLGLQGRYFQYQIIFDRLDSGLNPYITDINLDYDLTALAPEVNIFYPINSQVFGMNDSIPLNFSVTNSTSPLNNCWYSLDSGQTTNPINSCTNTSFSVSGSGNYNLILYANESQAGLTGVDQVNFSVELNSPEVSLISPQNGSYTNLNSIPLSYNSTDSNLDSCSLYGSFTGSYQLIATNFSVVSGINYFFVSPNEGFYSWAVSCNDTTSKISTTQNYSLIVDKTSPSITLISPIGTYTELINVPLVISYDDSSPVNCYYNVSFQGSGAIVIPNTNVDNCNDVDFGVDSNSNYALRLKINDSAGNSAYTNTTFTINAPASSSGSTGSSGSSGGGSSGGSFFVPNKINLSLSNNYLLKGKQENLVLYAVNKGNRFLNECSLIFGGDLEAYFSNAEIQPIGNGQEVSYEISVNLPADIDSGIYNLEIAVACNELTEILNSEINVLTHNVELNILEVERTDVSRLDVSYSLQENLGEEQTVILRYKILSYPGLVEFSSGEEEILVGANAKSEYLLEIPLPKDSYGEFRLIIEVSSDFETYQEERPVVVSAGGVTGFAISSSNRTTLSYIFFIIIFVVGAFLAFRYARNYKSKLDSNGEKRRLIRLNLED